MTRGAAGRRVWLLRLAVAAIIVVELEAMAWGLLSLVRAWEPQYVRISDAELLAAFDEFSQERYFGGRWDPLLGWDNRPNSGAPSDYDGRKNINADGARTNPPFEQQRPLVAAYGDSFTYGTDVRDNETWPVHLSGLLGRHVVNFGVSSYGMDQALLKYKVKHADRPATPYVIFALWERNFYRLFYRYRPFSIGGIEAILGFKPMFTLDGDRLNLVENPAREPPLDRDRFMAAVTAAKSGDLQYARRVDVAFPYSYNLARLAPIVVSDLLGLDLPVLGVLPDEEWQSRTCTRLMRAIIDDFLATVAQRRSRAIVLFIPDTGSIRNRLTRRPSYAAFIDALRRDYAGHDAIFVDVTETKEEFDPARFQIQPFIGHTSDFGNGVIARQLAAEMEKRWGSDLTAQVTPAALP